MSAGFVPASGTACPATVLSGGPTDRSCEVQLVVACGRSKSSEGSLKGPMGLTKNLIVAGLTLLLASLGQGAAAIGDPGGASVRPDIGSTGDDPSATACMGAQCSLEDLKSATRAIAMSAGAKPAAALDAPSMLPESSHKTVWQRKHVLARNESDIGCRARALCGDSPAQRAQPALHRGGESSRYATELQAPSNRSRLELGLRLPT